MIKGKLEGLGAREKRVFEILGAHGCMTSKQASQILFGVDEPGERMRKDVNQSLRSLEKRGLVVCSPKSWSITKLEATVEHTKERMAGESDQEGGT